MVAEIDRFCRLLTQIILFHLIEEEEGSQDT